MDARQQWFSCSYRRLSWKFFCVRRFNVYILPHLLVFLSIQCFPFPSFPNFCLVCVLACVRCFFVCSFLVSVIFSRISSSWIDLSVSLASSFCFGSLPRQSSWSWSSNSKGSRLGDVGNCKATPVTTTCAYGNLVGSARTPFLGKRRSPNNGEPLHLSSRRMTLHSLASSFAFQRSGA